MDARRSVLLAVAIVTVVATAIVAVSPRPPRRQVAEDVPPAPPRMTPADVFTMFARPSAARSFDTPVSLAVEDVGVLVLPSGGLVASDAFIIDGTPFTLDVPAGRYPVSVLRSDFQDGDRRIAAALVRVADGDPVRWELALVPGQDPTSLAPDEVFGYGVDSGTGAFTSPEAVAWLKDESRYTAYSDELLAAIPGTTLNDPLAAVVTPDGAGGANVVAFAAGFGDGAYPSYAGFDGDGALVVVLTDFGVLDAPRD